MEKENLLTEFLKKYPSVDLGDLKMLNLGLQALAERIWAIEEKQSHEISKLKSALKDCTDWMESLRTSGDAGFWDWGKLDPETEPYIKAMKLLNSDNEAKEVSEGDLRTNLEKLRLDVINRKSMLEENLDYYKTEGIFEKEHVHTQIKLAQFELFLERLNDILK